MGTPERIRGALLLRAEGKVQWHGGRARRESSVPRETEVERPRLAFVILNRVERTGIPLNLPRPMSLSPR